MKKFLFLALALSLTTGIASAQKQGGIKWMGEAPPGPFGAVMCVPVACSSGRDGYACGGTRAERQQAAERLCS